MKNFLKAAIIFAAALLLLTACSGGSLPHKGSDGSVSFDGFEMRATSSAPYGTAPDSAFLLTAPEGYSTDDIKKMLSVTPAFDFDISAAKDGGFTVTPKATLSLSTEYAFKLSPNGTKAEPKSFTFKTMGTFALLSSYPEDGGAGIPTGCAVEFTFTTPVADISQYLTWEPAVTGTYSYVGNKAIFMPDGGQLSSNTTYKVTLASGTTGKYGGALGSDYTVSFTTGMNYEGDASYQLTANGNDSPYYETFLPDESPMINIRNNAYSADSSAANKEADFSVTVYALPSSDDYLYYIYELRGVQKLSYTAKLNVATDKLEQVSAFTQKLDFSSDFAAKNGYAYISFPDALPAGWYVANVTTENPDGSGEMLMQKLIQVSPITFYQQTYNGEGLLWLNNGVTGKAVSNVSFGLFRDPTSTSGGTANTDENGLTVFKFPAPDPNEARSTYNGDPTPAAEQPTAADYAFYYTVKDADGTLANVAYSDVAKDKSFRQKYYTYLYTDRTVYKQSDTVEFWGVVLPRSGDYQTPAKVDVMFGLALDGSDPVLKQTADVAADGTFRGSFKLDGIASRSYNVSFCESGADVANLAYDDVCSAYVSVYQYKKPDYTYSAALDKEYYNYSDTVKATFTASFFDGTPASGMPFSSSYNISDPWYNFDDTASATTDKSGTITRTVSLSDMLTKNDVTGLGWRPATFTFQFTNSAAEDSSFSMTKDAHFFPSDTMVVGSAVVDKGKATLSVAVNKIDLSGLTKFEDWANDDCAAIKGEGLSRDVHVEIMHSYNVKTQTGTYYDPYTKESVPSYTYEPHNDSYATFEQKTSADGTLTLTGLPACDGDNTYVAVITVTDGLGKTLTENVYLGEHYLPYYTDGNGYTPDYGSGLTYSFDVNTTAEQNEYSSYPWSYISFNAGDDIGVSLLVNGEKAEIAKGGRWITDVVQNNVVSTSYQTGSSMTLKADSSLFPNFMLCGAYFDGRRVYTVNGRSLSINTSDMALDVSVDTDAESYLPGGKLSATVTVLDKDGKPQKNADVCLGVVNEAVFAVEEQYVDFAGSLYYTCFEPYPVVSSSYNQRGAANLDTGGGKGGGGGEDVLTMRANFNDTAGFVTGKTDANGKATFSLDLPDDLTSWRLSALALSSDLKAGFIKNNVVTTLPFFVRPIMNSYSLSGENAALMLRGFGTGVGSGDKIDFTVSVDGKEAISYSGKVGDYTPASLGTLTPGEHKVAVTGKCGSYSDGIEKTVTVVSSALEMKLTKWFDLSKETVAVDTDKSPLTVILTNSDWEPFLKAYSVVDGGWTARNDEKLARELCGKALTEFYGGTGLITGDYLMDVSLSEFANSNVTGEAGGLGILKLLPYGGEDILFTARAAVAAPSAFNNAGYEYQIVNALTMAQSGTLTLSANEKAALMMALCAVRSSYTTIGDALTLYDGTTLVSDETVRALLDSADTPTRAKCYAITALSYIHPEEAAKLYKEKILPLLKDEDKGKYLPAEGEDRAVSVTAAALLAGIRTGVTDNSAAMVEYIAGKQGSIYTRGDAAIEAALYMNAFKPERDSAPVVSYKLNGKTVKADLDKAHAVKLVLTRDEFAAADFKLESGTATAQVDYYGSPADAGFENSPDMTLTREFVSEESGFGGVTSIVYHIKFAAGAEYGAYRLTDWVPSNLRAKVENSWNADLYAKYGGEAYWSEFDMENQLFSAYIWYSETSGREFTIVLHAQNVIKSEALTDTAYLINTDTMAGTSLAGGEKFSWK